VFSTIVIGVDGSDTAQRACDEGVALAKELGARIHLVTAFSDSSTGGSEMTDEQLEAQKMLDATAEACNFTGGITTHALRGSPAATILKVADQVDAELIVVGNQGMTGVRRVLGSVASAVTTQSPCTVMVVKTS
jgi:nucleotide-binding universal stress UspA family protein